MTNNPTFRRYNTLALALIAGLSGAGSLAIAQPAEVPPTDTPREASGKAFPTPQESAVMAEFGRGVLAHVDAAAASLAAEDSGQALLELTSAQQLLAQIRADTDQELIPVFARIGLTREYTLSAEVQETLHSVADLALQGDHERVVAILEATGAPMGYIHVSMPLAGTTQQVESAIQALHEDRPTAAQTAMDQIVDDLHTDTITVGDDSTRQVG